jgi:plastocyanin
MRFTTAAVLSTFAGMAAAQTNHTVMVGMGGLHFVPNNLTAAVNDMVTFVFTAKNQCVLLSCFRPGPILIKHV